MKTYEELTADVAEKVKKKEAKRRDMARSVLTVFLSVVLIGSIVTSAALSGRTKTVVPTDTAETDEPNADPVTVKTGVVTARRDYGDIFRHISSGNGDVFYKDDVGIVVQEEEGRGSEIPTANSSPETGANGGADADYSKTNVQVEGIDEADVVKTDGKYIYAVGGDGAYIISADNGIMETVAKIPLTGADSPFSVGGTPGGGYFSNCELYITDDRLVVVAETYDYGEDQADGEYFFWGYGDAYLSAAVFDIADRTAPTLISSCAISGNRVSSRLSGDRLCLVAAQRFYGEILEEEPSTYIPTVYENGEGGLVGADRIFSGDGESECEYLNIALVDIGDASVTANLSLLGYDGHVMYQSENNVYVARTDWSYDVNEYEEDGFVVETYETGSDSVIAKISFDGGLALVGSARLDGYLHNSFSMDEYDGYLRVVTSVRNDSGTYKYRRGAVDYETEQYETSVLYGSPEETGADYETDVDYPSVEPFEESTWDEEMYNNLYVLDAGMNVTGSIVGLAEDERIYSCRFEGTDGYFVTYRETDPLFHVDLSDPTDPRVIDELKIPGHSDYLERFGDHLFGFGQDDDGNLKLSMFSESADGAMNEIAVITLPGVYESDALYDHHAILADAERGLICFGAYGEYDEEYGKRQFFIVKWNGQSFDVVMRADAGDYAWTSRALYIGDFIYFYSYGGSANIRSFDLSTCEQVGFLELGESERTDPVLCID
ncbi:MAG: beta-propeller domain-containing protein [Clostridia bacterium]|nr:beta-propeller domain-containing protein [Clostridia bacterium]